MKKCSSCKQEKELEEFNKNKGKSDGLNTMCRECSKISSKRYYSENTEYHKKAIVARNKTIRRTLHLELSEYKSNAGCHFCPETDSCCLDFHHLDSNLKEGNIATMVHASQVKKVREEIKKCAVVCANCHRKLHAGKLTI